MLFSVILDALFCTIGKIYSRTYVKILVIGREISIKPEVKWLGITFIFDGSAEPNSQMRV